MKHQIGSPTSENQEQRKRRAAFEAWMAENYPGMELDTHQSSGYYRDSSVNACWEIWLHLSEPRG